MKHAFYLFVFLFQAFTLTSAESDYMKDLEELGYCVIPNVISQEETKQLYQRVWHEYIEKAWPNCKMDDRTNWKDTFPIHNKKGVFAGTSGQIQVMWDVRQDPRVVDIFAEIWNTHDLSVSMDGMSLMCPSEIREGYFEPWPHVDQSILHFESESSLKTAPFTIQGQFLFEDSMDGDGGFYCIPKSHLQFLEFSPRLEIIQTTLTGEERRLARTALFNEFFGDSFTHVTAPRGSLILWDSRTVHWNQHANVNRNQDNPKVRMVGYVCYIPKARVHEAAQELRKKAFDTGVATTHDPASPVLRQSCDFMDPGLEKYLEDPEYTPPEIKLTALGESLLGISQE